MKVGVFTPLLSGLPLDDVLKKLKSLGLDTVEFGTGNYPGDAHVKLSMLDNPGELQTFKSKIADAGMTISALSSHGNPLHPDGMFAFFQMLRKEGFSVQEIDQIAKKNPAALLGLH